MTHLQAQLKRSVPRTTGPVSIKTHFTLDYHWVPSKFFFLIPSKESLIKTGRGSIWKAVPGVALRLFLPNTFITSSLWPHLYGTTSRQQQNTRSKWSFLSDYWLLGRHLRKTRGLFLNHCGAYGWETEWNHRVIAPFAACFYVLERRRDGNLEQWSCYGAASLLWIFPKSWDFKSTLALNGVVGWLIAPLALDV